MLEASLSSFCDDVRTQLPKGTTTVADQIEENIRTLLVRHMEISETREKDRVTREEIRAEADGKFRGEVSGALKTLQGKQQDHEQKFKEIEAATEGKFRKVLVSITEGDNAVLAKVADHNAEVVALLKGQNEAAERKEHADAEIAQKNESMRARHKVETIKAKSPLWLAIVGLAGLAISNISNCKATQDAAKAAQDKQEQTSRSLTTLASKMDAITIPNSAAPAVPAMSAPGSGTAATAPASAVRNSR